MIKQKFTKKSVILSCGGGVVGDVSALAASLYLRGTIYYHSTQWQHQIAVLVEKQE